MKRQCSAVSPSSSRRENSPAEKNIHAKTIGCMSGILHLLSNSHSRRHRRLLTFGKKQTKNHSSLSSTTLQGENVKGEKMADVDVGHNSRSSCEVLRSPTLPAQIRRLSSSTPVMAAEKRTNSPALVARLMGLEKVPATPSESVEGKRLRLMGALQRCDEDLKALKKIIESMRSEDYAPAPEAVVKRSAVVDKVRMVPVLNEEKQQPSPVTVLDEFTRAPLSSSCYSGRQSFGQMQQQKQQLLLKKPGEEEMNSTYMNERIMTNELIQKKVNNKDNSLTWSTKAMVKTVEEVCRDIAWGENRELGRIGLALQDYICKDLIEEIVRDLGCFYTLPFETCKRRLCF
ncbi:unnamed protein product [Lupinus luteus]|uniref:DUF3741 domain-containing protein n=1 Tax=Lupinus luteus TaxID=3873 RepID=A0AAV1XMT2_LUPLU